MERVFLCVADVDENDVLVAPTQDPLLYDVVDHLRTPWNGRGWSAHVRGKSRLELLRNFQVLLAKREEEGLPPEANSVTFRLSRIIVAKAIGREAEERQTALV